MDVVSVLISFKESIATRSKFVVLGEERETLRDAQPVMIQIENRHPMNKGLVFGFSPALKLYEGS